MTLLGVAVSPAAPPALPAALLGGAVAAAAKLTWSPPTMTNPTTVTVPASNAEGFFQYDADAGEDVLLVLPAERRVGNVTVVGGRHVTCIGGAIEIMASPTADQDQLRRCLYLKDQTGTLHVEGVTYHRNATDDGYDAIFVATDSDTVVIQIQNCRIDGIEGTSAGWHADAFQVLDTSLMNGAIRWDRVTVRGDYQGYYNVSDGTTSTATFTHTNWVVTGEAGVMLWLGDNDIEAYSRKFVTFSEGCYLAPFTGATLDDEVRPNSDCAVVAERPVFTSGVMTWPTSEYITGSLIAGAPPDGDWCPEGAAGLGYTSPGYL